MVFRFTQLFVCAVCAASLAGCGATTSPVQSPQLQTPLLNNPGDNRSNFASRFGSNAANAGKTGSGITSPEEAAYAPIESVQIPPDTFLALPYVQWGSGDDKEAGAKQSLVLLWHTPASGASEAQNFSVETRRAATASGASAASGPWTPAQKPTVKPFAGGDSAVPAHRIWRTSLQSFAPGALFDYRVLRDGKPIFSARTRAPRSVGSSFRVVLWGNSGAATEAQKKIAYQASLTQPDFLCLTGDLAGGTGRGSDYQKNFFPVYNTDTGSAGAGAPLLRSTLLFAALGTEDRASRDLGKTADGLAYFSYLSLPLNGPVLDAPAAEKTQSDAGEAFSRMANYSFDYGGTHWAVLDSAPSANWQTGPLRAWLQNDLARAQKAEWRFVVFQNGPFASSKTEGAEPMRVLCELLQKYKVSVVWSGGEANYQRTYPMVVKAGESGGDAKTNQIKWTLDKNYNGDKKTQPQGIIYIVTGAGGANLEGKPLEATPSGWQPFTRKYVASTHSFSQMDVAPKSLTVRQISENGKELDKWVITQ